MAIIPIAKREKTVTTVSEDIENKVNGMNTTSGRIRFLHSLGYSRTQIASILDIRYQWVRNVLENPPKK
jgi:hypothetical protein